MSNHYSGSEWIKARSWCPAMSPLGEAVADLLGDWALGIYHLNTAALERCQWGDPHFIEFVFRGSAATFDDNLLTVLVVLCHDRRIRCEIKGVGPGYMRMLFHKRESRTGAYWQRHPTIEAAIESIRAHYQRVEWVAP